VWLVKIGVRAAAVLVVIAVLVLIAACWQVELQFRLQVEANKPKPEEFRAVSDLLTLGHLALVPVYGFALAQFFGMVCRKGAVAVVLSALTGVGLLALWLPSVVIGGLSAWQWIGPPLILLATTRLAMRPWVAGRLWRGRPAAAWVGAVLLAAAGVAAGLWSRAAVVPDVGPPFDVVAFVAAAPTPEQNESGRKLRQARQQFITLRDQARAQHEPPFVPGQTDWASLSNQARDAINNGWPAKADELNAWMDQLFAGEWVTTLRQAVALPPGVVAQPRLPTEPDQEDVFRFLEMAVLLNARAVQLQARGEHEQAWDMLRLALATARHLRHRAGLTLYTVAENIEQTALRAVPRWAAAAAGRPDLLRRAVTALREDEAALPPFAEVLQTEYAAARERLDLPPPVHPNETPFGWQLRQLAQAAPWERDRTLRGLNLLYAGWLRNATLDYPTALKRANTVAIETGPISPLAYELLAPWVPADTGADAVRQRRLLARLVDSFPQAGIELPWFTGVFVWERYDRVLWRAAQLQVGLLLYEREHGRPAERLGALVLDILPAVPIDPFGNEPFHYRVSTGEPPPMSEREDDQGRVTAAPGQGVIWSVSTDGRDDGGKRYDTLEQLFGRGSRQPESDLIFLVPRPTKP
jgi:hypothetical protein